MINSVSDIFQSIVNWNQEEVVYIRKDRYIEIIKELQGINVKDLNEYSDEIFDQVLCELAFEKEIIVAGTSRIRCAWEY
jgi:hypothetical protein